ncbi:unnamed protein product [Cylicocyclus nassatus]|uniref:Gamma interferon inducible lysosomal thiol reductase GILT n=1 Tax=Cylicocyclus nassatus TaxID=53992 RepID=A0AA36H627_CYLNA|nr:unnamed protein product [Cylicocyclus nassatus]
MRPLGMPFTIRGFGIINMLVFLPLMLMPFTTRAALVKSNTPPPPFVPGNSIDEQNGNVVVVDVVGESRCPDTTRFYLNQLLPVFKRYRSRLRLNYHPYGPYKYTKCSRTSSGFECTCQHGSDECQKNALQACLIEALPNAEDHLDIVGCIQGPRNFNTSFQSCIVNHPRNGLIDQASILECATNGRGMKLMSQHGEAAHVFAEDVYWVPWISINGLRIPAAERHFEAVLCNQYFEPPPSECLNPRL